MIYSTVKVEDSTSEEVSVNDPLVTVCTPVAEVLVEVGVYEIAQRPAGAFIPVTFQLTIELAVMYGSLIVTALPPAPHVNVFFVL